MIRTRAVYRDGTLVPAGPVNLTEGATVDLAVTDSTCSDERPRAEGLAWIDDLIKLKEKMSASMTEEEIQRETAFFERFEAEKSRRRQAVAEAYGFK